MPGIFRHISVCQLMVVLLLQPVCPVMAADCICKQSIHSYCSTDVGNGCCSTIETPRAIQGCPHCRQPTNDSQAIVAAAICHCGDHVPDTIPLQTLPEPTGSESLSWETDDTVCIIETLSLTIVPARSQVPSSETLISNFTQIVYCVWLT